MDKLNRDELKSDIGKFYLENIHRGRKFTVNKYKNKLISESTIYRLLRTIDNNQPITRKHGSGRKRKKLHPKTIDALKRVTIGKVARSFRWMAKKFKRAPNTIKKDLNDLGIMIKKRIKKPKVNESQKITQRKRLNKARKGSLKPSSGFDVIEDDETYFGFQSFYHNKYFTIDGYEVPKKVKYKYQEKFPPKLLMWLAISPKGRSKPFFMSSGGAVNSKIYKELCIRERLFPFIKKFHFDEKYIFWPDLASSHYSKETLSTLRELGIRTVPKDENPPCAPQIRRIEQFWGELKRRVYANDWQAFSKPQLESRIKYILKTFDKKYFFNLMSNAKTLVRRAADIGLENL
jgi:hypothetical protein